LIDLEVFHIEAKSAVRKQIVRELKVMHDCNSEYILPFYGAFQDESGDVVMCSEYMDVGLVFQPSTTHGSYILISIYSSFSSILKRSGPIRVDVLGKVAEATLGGLTYLFEKHRIMHRDVRPSSVLINSEGQIKLSDFGVSGTLSNSIADSFVGTSTYMSPEKVQGAPYTVTADVWSFGLMMVELATGTFPYSSGLPDDSSILDFLQQVVYDPAPRLPESEAFPDMLHELIEKCLKKDPKKRPKPQELFVIRPLVRQYKALN
jgi:mitogen-activated protein kinase kinase